MNQVATVVELPMQVAEFFLDYFYKLPMNESEQVVNAMRQFIGVANEKANQPAEVVSKAEGEDAATV